MTGHGPASGSREKRGIERERPQGTPSQQQTATWTTEPDLPKRRSDVDGRARCPRNECRRGGIGQASERRNVESDHLVRHVALGIQQRRDGANAGIVDDHGDGLIFPQQPFDLLEICLVAAVPPHPRTSPPPLLSPSALPSFQLSPPS